MPLALNRFPRFFGGAPALEFLIVSAVILLAACSSPKAAAPPLKSASAVAGAAGPLNSGDSNSAHPDPFVAAVRGGTMSGYPQATIGKAFEGAFSDAQWRSEQPDDGGRRVTFTGFLPARMRTDCGPGNAGSDAPCAQNSKVTFEWTFASDGRLFHLSRIDPEPWPEDRRSTREMLLYIFG